MNALPPVELQATDIGRWKESGTGIDWVHAFDSGRPGPAVMVQALTQRRARYRVRCAMSAPTPKVHGSVLSA